MSQPRDHSDPFAPPATPCEVQCAHCGECYDSWQIEWRDLPDDPHLQGAWCCPTAGCDGIGFGFDIFPVDPDWVDERGERLISTGDEGDDLDDDEEVEDDDAIPFLDFNTDDDEEDGLPIDAFDADSFWIDVDSLLPPALGNSPQTPFTKMAGTKKPWSHFDENDIPF